MNYNLAEYTASFGVGKQLPAKTLPEVVFAGHSNVGKSSMLNRLLFRKNLARTSSSPGKTGTINFFTVGAEAERIFFVDFPGYGYAKVSASEKERWAELCESYFRENRANLIVQLLDIRHPPSKDDVTMVEFLRELSENAGTPFLIALTKADKLKKKELEKQTAFFDSLYPGVKKIIFSAETGQGADEIKREIESIIL
ncbi:putative GTP-binding protein EngB [Clostridia bacterium]|nr:putative GTP-binding protein EngB [Clostridia bacterium]